MKPSPAERRQNRYNRVLAFGLVYVFSLCGRASASTVGLDYLENGCIVRHDSLVCQLSMTNPLPAFDHNLVMPPHRGNPTDPGDLSPYHCTTVDLCERFGTSPERRQILIKFLDFREQLRNCGLTNGFQRLDGSFLEDVETSLRRAPHDLDTVTVYWGYDIAFQSALISRFPEFANPPLSKANYSLDHYPFDAGADPVLTIEMTRYWILLFSHNRLGVWKGMARIDLNTPAEDNAARLVLASPTS